MAALENLELWIIDGLRYAGIPAISASMQPRGRHRAHAGQGPGPVEIDSRKLPGKLSAAGPGRRQPGRLRPRRARDAGAAIPLARRARASRRGGEGEGAVHVDHEHAAAAYLKRIPGLDAERSKPPTPTPRCGTASIPAYMTLCSPDPQAFRPPDEKINVLQVTLPTNFKAARFDSDEHTAMLRDLQADIEAARFDAGGEKIELPVKLKVHDSVFVPLAKWPMLITGNYRCVTKDGPRADQGGGAHEPRGVARGLRLGARALHRARRLARRPGAVREIRRRGAGLARRPPRRARCSPARRTSSGSTGWCRRSRRRRACAIPSSTRPSRWSTTAWRQTGRRLPDRRRSTLSRLTPLGSRLAFHESSPRAGRCPDPGLRCVAGVRENTLLRETEREFHPLLSRAHAAKAECDPGPSARSCREAAPNSFAEAFGRRGAWGEVIRPRDRKAGQAPPAMA